MNQINRFLSYISFHWGGLIQKLFAETLFPLCVVHISAPLKVSLSYFSNIKSYLEDLIALVPSWDGRSVSWTSLSTILENAPLIDALGFQIDCGLAGRNHHHTISFWVNYPGIKLLSVTWLHREETDVLFPPFGIHTFSK